MRYTISLKLSKAYIEHLSFRTHLWFIWIFILKIYVIHYQERATQPNSNENLKMVFIRQKLRVRGNSPDFRQRGNTIEMSSTLIFSILERSTVEVSNFYFYLKYSILYFLLEEILAYIFLTPGIIASNPT